ncbi:hypothetical protein [Orenia marismortui]|uniref:hypothetical protein n=1 Tax=Orenia marismortui TaxID=46469 RepID=UPI0003816984|nr:hypothetical protein [Orenia marismortui]
MSSTPRRKQFKRKQRLQSAKTWIPTYTGKNLVRGYKRWYGVNFVCAIKELEMLGYEIDLEYKEQILKQEEAKRKAAKRRKAEEKKKQAEEEYFNSDQDENFYYIAGYTSGGAPYGITWWEYERDIKGKEDDNKNKNSVDPLKDVVPF